MNLNITASSKAYAVFCCVVDTDKGHFTGVIDTAKVSFAGVLDRVQEFLCGVVDCAEAPKRVKVSLTGVVDNNE